MLHNVERITKADTVTVSIVNNIHCYVYISSTEGVWLLMYWTIVNQYNQQSCSVLIMLNVSNTHRSSSFDCTFGLRKLNQFVEKSECQIYVCELSCAYLHFCGNANYFFIVWFSSVFMSSECCSIRTSECVCFIFRFSYL